MDIVSFREVVVWVLEVGVDIFLMLLDLVIVIVAIVEVVELGCLMEERIE